MRFRLECIVSTSFRDEDAILIATILVFCPRKVFRSLYYDTCYKVHRNVYSIDELTQVQCDRIESCITALFDNMTLNSRPSAHVYLENLLSQNNYWGWLRSNRICLICIRCYPEYSLPCSHSLCDIYIQIFGTLLLYREEEYYVTLCPFCGSRKALTVRLKLSTSASRILSIDGGGSRGIIPLENLNIL